MKISENKIGIFTDIHWGKSRDNVKKLKNASEFIDKFINEMLKAKVKTVFFLGDWYDHRNSVNVNTGYTAYNSIKKLCKHFKVFMILGNHDTYYKHSVEVNSIKPYESLNNLTIISKTTECDVNGKKILLCPWGFNILKHKDKEYDYLFGHFEPNGANLIATAPMIMQNSTYNMNDLCTLAPIVFSGHYHVQKSYPTEKGTYISVGCPLELDWGDYQNKKGFYIIDIAKNERELIENDFSPQHIKYYWSRLKKGEQELSEELIKNNYVKIIIDDKYKYEDIMRIMEAVQNLDPISAEPEFIFSINKDLLSDVDMQSTVKLKNTKLEYIIKYIEKMRTDEGFIENINKESLMIKATSYYKKVEL